MISYPSDRWAFGLLGFFSVAEEIPAGRLVHLRPDGLLQLADGPESVAAHGVVLQTIAAGAAGQAYRLGEVRGLSGKHAGLAQWLGASGQFTETPPTAGISQVVGVAIAADTVALGLHMPVQL